MVAAAVQFLMSLAVVVLMWRPSLPPIGAPARWARMQ